MEMLKNIRLKRGKSILRKRIPRTKRTRFKSNISKARTIGVVWDASNHEEYTILSRFHQKMHERKIEVKILGFFPGNNLPDRYTAIRYLTCLKNQDIDLFYRPVSREAALFINTRFDILIDINFKQLFPLQYISSLSVAGFKVGIVENGFENPPYDLMMELNKNSDINTYLTQVIYYLEMINTGTNNKRI
jgi:hypothetical protein